MRVHYRIKRVCKHFRLFCYTSTCWDAQGYYIALKEFPIPGTEYILSMIELKFETQSSYHVPYNANRLCWKTFVIFAG